MSTLGEHHISSDDAAWIYQFTPHLNYQMRLRLMTNAIQFQFELKKVLNFITNWRMRDKTANFKTRQKADDQTMLAM